MSTEKESPQGAELFSIKNNEARSIGARLVFGKLPTNPDLPVLTPEMAVNLSEEGGFKAIGAFYWQRGNLGELWEEQLETYQFILDHLDLI